MSNFQKILDSFNLKDTLNPKIWDNPEDPKKAKMKPKVKQALMKIENEFIDYYRIRRVKELWRQEEIHSEFLLFYFLFFLHRKNQTSSGTTGGGGIQVRFCFFVQNILLFYEIFYTFYSLKNIFLN